MAAGQQVAVPAQYRVRLHQQPEPAEHVPREAVHHGGQERSVASGESWPGRAELPLQDRDLMAQRQDLDVLVLVACRQQPQ
jgi:hypothetical protein